MEQEMQEDIINKPNNQSQSAPPPPVDEPRYNIRLFILILIIVIAISALAVSMLIYRQTTKSKDNISQNTSPTVVDRIVPAVIPTDDISNWILYKNEQFQYEVEYPKNWKLIEAKPRIGNKVEWAGNILLENELQKVTFTEDEEKTWPGSFQIIVLENNNNDSLEIWIDKNRPRAAGGADLVRGAFDTVLDSTPAKRLSIFGFDREILEIVVLKNSKIYKLIFDGDNPNDPDTEEHTEIYEKIVSSFKFIGN